MKRKTTIFASIKRLWKFFSVKWKSRIAILIVFMFISGLAEMIALGSVVPFLAALTNSSAVLSYPFLSEILDLFDVNEEKELIVFFSTLFCLAVVISATLRLFIARLNYKWCYELIAELAIEVFYRTLHQPYLVHVSRNSSEIVSGISQKTAMLLSSLILPTINSVQLVILVTSIIAALVLILPISNIIALGSFAVLYAFISLLLRKNLDKNSRIIALQNVRAIKILQESLAGIKDIILGNSYNHYVNKYSKSERAHRSGLGRNAFMTISPRFIVEALGIILIVVLAYSNYVIADNLTNVLPSIGALAFGAQRMLPYLQQLYAAYAAMAGNRQSVVDALDLLEQPVLKQEMTESASENLDFSKSIELRNVNFRYSDKSKFALKKLNLTIRKGEILGIIGSTGGGKTTLIDLILGLIQPDEGELVIDGKALTEFEIQSWQSKVFHVPQQIFLADTSIKENIALGLKDELVSIEKVIESAQKAQLEDYINTLPLGYETTVGERGTQLSGGQRQRIGIARALYKGGAVLVLDEATNALDMKTESNIIQTIRALKDDLTIIIVAHNLDTVKDCDRLLILDQGKIVEEGTFSEIKLSESFRKISGELI